MSDDNKKQSQKQAASTDDVGQQEVQDKFAEADDKGYFGIVPDPTPNENYTLQTGQDAPTPEVDEGLADQASANQRKIAREGVL